MRFTPLLLAGRYYTYAWKLQTSCQQHNIIRTHCSRQRHGRAKLWTLLCTPIYYNIVYLSSTRYRYLCFLFAQAFVKAIDIFDECVRFTKWHALKMISIKSDFTIICAFINTRERYCVCLPFIFIVHNFPTHRVCVSCNSTITSDIILQMQINQIQ